jgi:hypothetical protein
MGKCSMRLIIAGSRTFANYQLLETNAKEHFPEAKIIVSGGAHGADILGEQYAKAHGLELVRYPADWKKYGRAAGYIRNKEMAQNAHALLAFWDGRSKGTRSMIKLAEVYLLEVVVVRF